MSSDDLGLPFTGPAKTPRTTRGRHLGLKGLQDSMAIPVKVKQETPPYSQRGKVGHVAEGVIGQHADAVVAQVTR